MTYHRLEIVYTTGGVSNVYGTQEVLETALAEFRNYLASSEIEQAKYLEVQAYTDTADRASIRVLAKFENIIGMNLTQMC